MHQFGRCKLRQALPRGASTVHAMHAVRAVPVYSADLVPLYAAMSLPKVRKHAQFAEELHQRAYSTARITNCGQA